MFIYQLHVRGEKTWDKRILQPLIDAHLFTVRALFQLTALSLDIISLLK